MSPSREVAGKPIAKPATRRFGFFSDIISELKKVTWPTRQETTNLTIIVIVVSIAVGVFLGLVDLGFSQLMNFILVR